MADSETNPKSSEAQPPVTKPPEPQPPVAQPPGAQPATVFPAEAYPYGAYPPGAFPPGAYPPNAYPPGAYPPGAYLPTAQQPVVQAPGVYGNPAPLGPGSIPLMPVPTGIPNCPPGLEYLTQVDQLLVHQQVELLEVLTGFETNNKYQIKNSLGQLVYFAAEENDFCNRNCCGNLRSFDMKILDNLGQEVINLYRPLRCAGCCCPCCLQELEVKAPPGEPVGYVIQTWDICLPKFTIQNEKKEPVLKIIGPCCICNCCSDIDFKVTNLDESETVGKISKQWTGLTREAFTDATNFGIQFPMDLDVKMKAVMLGACFLIDYVFFEKNN
ncbi:phospholipid scramblase 2-like [Chiloscyllium plagiosum]|uniref:phospholipid scramblase 2-like n=1 Tax=Chiloscyllium plagiosum TaxID=36176 RepID=UPI001CB7C3ED|nr:phospholipid scramblase 2-like [Chiloscyllium plagiosum]XP_043558634.1 phospholipid scramblase 2-like [Chiloscyllium plagiosum]